MLSPFEGHQDGESAAWLTLLYVAQDPEVVSSLQPAPEAAPPAGPPADGKPKLKRLRKAEGQTPVRATMYAYGKNIL